MKVPDFIYRIICRSMGHPDIKEDEYGKWHCECGYSYNPWLNR